MLNSILERFPALVQGYINLYMRYRWRAFVICYRGAEAPQVESLRWQDLWFLTSKMMD